MLLRSSHNLFNSLTGYPVIRPAGYPAEYQEMKPYIRMDTVYKIGRISGQPDNRYNPRGVLSSIQLYILPHPKFLKILIFFPKCPSPISSSPLDNLPDSQNIIRKMILFLLSLFSNNILPNSHDILFPPSKLDILPRQTF